MLRRWIIRRRQHRNPHANSPQVRPRQGQFTPRLESLEDRTLLTAGALDPSFGTAGKVLSHFQLNHSASQIAVQPDGKIVVVGTSTGIDNAEFFIARYLPDGQLDPSFGTGGQVATAVGIGPESFDSASGVVVQPDGKIVVVGSHDSLSGHEEFALLRLNANGSLDRSFGSGGMVVTAFGPVNGSSLDAAATSVALQADGRIVVAGTVTARWSSEVPPPAGFMNFQEFAVARYTANGHLDSSFGTGGEVVTSFAPNPRLGKDQAEAVAVQADGKIVVVGTASNFDIALGPGAVAPNIFIGSQFALARYTLNGRLDASFGTGGEVLTHFPGVVMSSASGVAIQADGKIVVAGSAGERLALARYNRSGALDSTFGHGGEVTTTIAGTVSSSAVAVLVTPHGQLVAVGDAWVKSAQRQEFALARYLADGDLDQHFGTNGTVLTAMGSSGFTASGAALQRDGKVVVAGSTIQWGEGVQIALARYQGDPASSTGIRGVAMVGPIDPVERPGVPNSRPLPFAVITVHPAGGGPEIAWVRADAEGRFLLHLAPGRYEIVPLPPLPGQVFPRGIPETVVVGQDGFTWAVVHYDSGIL